VQNEYCTLTENGYHWEKLNATASYSTVPRFDQCKNIHVLCVLRQGGSGKCLLCNTTTGKMFTVKLFLIKPTWHYSGKDREADNQQSLKDTKKDAENELETWNKLAPTECHKYCKLLKLNGLYALTMPFFPPLPIAQRSVALIQVEQRLLASAKKGYVYDDYDVRWRHVGCRYSDNKVGISLLDMGSLSKTSISNEEEIQLKVEEHMASLKGRIGSDPEAAEPKAVLC
jgi:hypothetical protein